MTKQRVFIVDDDEAVADALQLLLESTGLDSEVFSTANDFLARYEGAPGCLLLDVRMPGMSGVELHKRLVELKFPLSVIFISGHGDIPMAVEAMKAGAVDFLQKPFREQELLDCVQKALDRIDQEQHHDAELSIIRQCLDTLTSREAQVLDYLVEGSANKVIAIELDISPRTVEIHRARVMEKMQARTLPDLVKKAMLLRASN